MSKKLKRDDYDKLDRALNEVESAEESGRVGTHASMRANLSRGMFRGNPCGSSLYRSLLEFFAGQIANCPGRDMFSRMHGALAAEIRLAASRSVKEKTLDKLLSVPVEDQTPNDVCAQGARSLSGATPSILRFPRGRPA